MLKAQQTYSVPHDYVDISTEGIIDMLGNVKIHKITEVMVHVNTWERKKELLAKHCITCSTFFGLCIFPD